MNSTHLKYSMELLFFDVGFTLVDETAVWEKRCAEQALTAEAKRLRLTSGDIYREIENNSIARLPQYRTVVRKYGFTEVAPYRHELETLYPEAPRVLETLARKYTLGVIANQTDGLQERLRDFGIAKYFTHIVSSWDAGIMKPDVRLYEYALREANCSPQCACMIGDRLDNDIAPAKATGMKTVWIKQGFGALQTPLSSADEPDYCVNSLAELTELF